MKRIIIVLTTILLTNCKAIGGDEYEIKGKVANASNQTIYLEKLSHKEMKLVDSTVIKNGQFSMKGVVDGIGFYRLKIKVPAPQNELFWFLTIDKKEKLTADLDLNDIGKYTILGNENQKEFQELIKNWGAQQAEMTQLYQQYQKFMNSNPESKEALEISAQLNSKNDNFNKYIQKIIQTAKSPMTKYYLYSVLLQQYQNQPVPDQLATDVKIFSDKLKAEMPKSVYTADFNAIVYNLEMQKQMALAKAKLDVGSQAPDVELAKEDGTKVKLSSFRGKVVLMDFWASWCRPCRMENPNVVAAYNKYKNKGFVIVSISQDQDLAKWQTAIAQDGLVWNTHYADKLTGNQASSMYEVSYIPKTYLIDKNGKIAAKDLRGAALEVELEKLLK